MNSNNLINLKLAHHEIQVEFNLECLLYRGGAAENMRVINQKLENEELGPPHLERLGLITKILDVLEAKMACGNSHLTIKNNINCLRRFYAWADNQNLQLNEENVTRSFIDWTDELIRRQRSSSSLKHSGIFALASKVASVLNEVLGVRVGLLHISRLKKSPNGRKTISTTAEKQNLSDLVTQGHSLLDIVNGLTVEKIRGSLPVTIQLRNGKILEEWSGLTPERDLKHDRKPSSSKTRENYCNDTSWKTRYPLINLRLEAELLIFISQTGMNFTQAYKIQCTKFSYQSDTNGYRVRRVYKNRKQGEVEFHIYSEYRKHFEEFLRWRSEIFPNEDDGLLFPLRSPKNRPHHVPPELGAIRKRFSLLGLKFICARELRKSRINWLLRNEVSEHLVASMHQHSESTLLKNYLRPHHQIAVVEVSRFFASIDPTLAPPGPGACVSAQPALIYNTADHSPKPDCINPAGCLFCENHRDIESFDHIWSLTTYRHCKSIELSRAKRAQIEEHPSLLTIEAIAVRLRHFKERSEQTKKWLGEAEIRVDEGDYHPSWDIFIQIMED